MPLVHREHTEASGNVSAVAALAKRIVVKLRETGPVFLALRTIHRITPDTLFTVSDLIIEAADIPAAVAHEPDPELRWATGPDLDIIAAAVPRAKLLLELFPHTSRIVTIMGENGVIAVDWYVTAPSNEAETWVLRMIEGGGWLRFRLLREDSWGLWTWVAPEHRGQRLMVRCRSFANVGLAAERYTRTWGAIYSGNERAIRAHAKRGTRIMSRVSYVRFLGLTFLRMDGARRIGFWTANRPLEIDVGALKTGDLLRAGRRA